MRIRFVCHGLACTGYGEAARAYVSALSRAGHDVSVSLLTKAQGSPESFGRKGVLLASLVEGPGRRLRPEVNMVCSTAAHFGPERLGACLNLGITTCETDRIPEHRVRACRNADGVIVMSEADHAAFGRSGVETFVAQPCAAPEDFPVPERVPRDVYQFVSVGVWTGRKNFRALLMAYCAEFEASEKVRLVLKTAPHHVGPGPEAQEIVEREVERIVESFCLQEVPPIEVVASSLTTAGMHDLLRNSDCYVSAHAGEGWGFPMFEATALGVPVVATGWGGNMDFMQSGYGIRVAYRMTPVAIDERSQAYDLTMRWADVDVLDLMRCMRLAKGAPGTRLGPLGRDSLLSNFTEARTAAALAHAIAEVKRRQAA